MRNRRMLLSISGILLFSGFSVHSQEQTSQQLKVQIENETAGVRQPSFTVTNPSSKTLTACAVEFSVSSESGRPSEITWDAVVQGIPPLKWGASFSNPLPHEVGKPYPDKAQVVAGVWDDGETFGNADWLKVILENRAMQSSQYKQAAALLQRGLDENWTYDQFLLAFKGMRDSGPVYGITSTLEASPQLKQNPNALHLLAHKLFDSVNEKSEALQKAKPPLANRVEEAPRQ